MTDVTQIDPRHGERGSALVLAILVASTVALFESNLKRLLAYSSLAQIGYIMLGASLVSVSGLSAGLLHMFNHALSKGTLFLAVVATNGHVCLAQSTDAGVTWTDPLNHVLQGTNGPWVSNMVPAMTSSPIATSDTARIIA